MYPAMFYAKDPKISGNPDAIFLNPERVVLTEYSKYKQQDGIYKASGKMQVYKL